jgi:hypothetical protein
MEKKFRIALRIITLLVISKAVQNGFPTRPEVKSAPEAYPLGYVENAGKPRTKWRPFSTAVIFLGCLLRSAASP